MERGGAKIAGAVGRTNIALAVAFILTFVLGSTVKGVGPIRANITIKGLSFTEPAFLTRPWDRQLLPDDAAARGISYLGSRERLIRVVNGLREGIPQSITFLGGSVTFGRGATFWGSSYPILTMDWIQRKFPAAPHSYKNSAIPASTSAIAAACTETLVPANASLVILEYSVNDVAGLGLGDPQRQAFEVLLRKLLAMPSRPAVIMLHHWCYSTAERNGQVGLFDEPDTETDFTLLGQYYDVPSLSLRAAALHLMRSGRRGFRVDGFGGPERGDERNDFFYMDPCHPTDSGHQVLSDLLINALQQTARHAVHDPGTGVASGRPAEPGLAGLPPPLQKGVHDVPAALCLLGEDFQPLVVQAQGFRWKADHPQAASWSAQKWGWQSDGLKDWATLKIDTRVGAGGGEEAAAAQHEAARKAAKGEALPRVTISLGYLKSYKGMGTASVECVSGCECDISFFDGLWDRQLSIVQTHQFEVTQHPNCQIRVKVEGRDDKREGMRVKLTSLAVTSMPVILGDTQAAEGSQDGAR